MKILNAKVYLDRLETLSFHLLYNTLYHKHFDITRFSNRAPEMCDTAGCALGECPSLFPKDWTWSNYYSNRVAIHNYPTLRVNDVNPWLHENLRTWECAKFFFGLNLTEAYHLFKADSQHPEIYGGNTLSFTATRDDVAHNIRDFIKRNNTPLKRFLNNVKALVKLRVNVFY